MAAGAGKDFVIKIETSSGVYTTLGGLQSSSHSGSAEAIDITSIDSSQWKELLDGAGTRSFALSGSGVLKDSAPVDNLRSAFLNQALTNFQLLEVNGTWQGLFKVTAFELSGEHNGAQTYSVSLESSGEISFT